MRIGFWGIQMNMTPLTPFGMPPEEITLAEALRDEGYSTGMVGKWHLGKRYGTGSGTHGEIYEYTIKWANSSSEDVLEITRVPY